MGRIPNLTLVLTAAGLALASLLGAFATNDLVWVKKAILAFWTLVPPIWFVVEWHAICDSGKKMTNDEFERFKHSQAAASKVWLAVLYPARP
jgi:hypothetical protein